MADILNTVSAGQSPAVQALIRILQDALGDSKNNLLNVDELSSSDSDGDSDSSFQPPSSYHLMFMNNLSHVWLSDPQGDG